MMKSAMCDFNYMLKWDMHFLQDQMSANRIWTDTLLEILSTNEAAKSEIEEVRHSSSLIVAPQADLAVPFH